RQETEREDEADDRDEVEETEDVRIGDHSGGSSRLGSGRRLNISSMRSVTNQPPTTFAVASTIATNPTTCVKVSSAKPRTRIAPTMTMPWMKFVPDMSGVCSMVGTFEITSKPRKAASTRIVNSR